MRGFADGMSLLYALGLGAGALGYLARGRGDEDVAMALFGASDVFVLSLAWRSSRLAGGRSDFGGLDPSYQLIRT